MLHVLETVFVLATGESEARAKTRARFDEVFKKYTDLPSERKKVKKRDPQPPESIVVSQNKMVAFL